MIQRFDFFFFIVMGNDFRFGALDLTARYARSHHVFKY